MKPVTCWPIPKNPSEMCEHNYEVARRFFSFSMLERRLSLLLADCFGETL